MPFQEVFGPVGLAFIRLVHELYEPEALQTEVPLMVRRFKQEKMEFNMHSHSTWAFKEAQTI